MQVDKAGMKKKEGRDEERLQKGEKSEDLKGM